MWFDKCWTSHQQVSDYDPDISSRLPHRNSYKYRSETVDGTEHNYLMDPAFGASEIWLQRVRDAFPVPVEV